MIVLSNVSFAYEPNMVALHHVNMYVRKGEFVFIVGPSGAGKSSVIKLLLREKLATEGTVWVNGHNLNRMKQKKIPAFRRTLGVVFQDFRLIPTLTVYDNVAFSLRVMGAPNRHIRRRVPEVLNMVGLQDKARRYPKELSGGEQQRVAIARALANEPSILIADEPTGNIDPQMSQSIMEMLREINQSGVTVVMVTHEHELVRSYGGRIIQMENGRISSDIIVPPQFEFGGVV